LYCLHEDTGCAPTDEWSKAFHHGHVVGSMQWLSWLSRIVVIEMNHMMKFILLLRVFLIYIKKDRQIDIEVNSPITETTDNRLRNYS